METRTLLVDGNNLFKRSFHGAKDVFNSKHFHIGGIYQFLTSIRKLTPIHFINKIVVAFEGENGGYARYQIDPQYKANRKNKEWYTKIELTDAEIRREMKKEESALYELKRIKAYLEEIFIHQIECENIESDDILAAYCLKYNNKEEIFLYSNDRDFAQLLDLNITILFPNINQPVNKTNYMMYFNHHYKNA